MTHDPVGAPLRLLAAAAGERGLAAARSWRRAGAPGERRIVGCFPVWTPAPVVEALGMRAVLLGGDADPPEPVHADGRLQSFVCALVRDVLQAACDGAYEDLDAVLVPSVCDAARNLAVLLRRALPRATVVYLHLPQASPSPAVRTYLEDELRRAAEALELVAGRRLDPGRLVMALADADRRARAVRRLRRLRRADPGRLSAAELRIALRGAAALPAAEAAHHLEAMVRSHRDRPPPKRDRVRTLLAGAFCEPPPAGFLAALEEGGCDIVDEDLFPGLAWFGKPVVERSSRSGCPEGTPDPLLLLAEAYLGAANPVASTIRHHAQRNPVAQAVGQARRVGAEAVVLGLPKFCEPAGYDAVRITRTLRAAGIPVTEIEYDERLSAFGAARTRVETLAESILFAPLVGSR